LQSLVTQHRYLLDLVAEYLEMSVDQIVEQMIDSSSNVDTLESLFTANGQNSVCFLYKMREAPGRESGRYNPQQRNERFMLATCSESAAEQITGTCVLAFRLGNTSNVDVKNLSEDILITALEVPEGKTLVTTIKETLDRIVSPSIAGFKEFGGCKDIHRKEFIDGIDLFLKFLCSTETDLDGRIVFEVPHALYKGHLLVLYQITTTAKSRERVAHVEMTFNHWTRQIQTAITEGQQIRRDPPDVGPLNELEFWRSQLATYAAIVEFVNSRPFNNFLACLSLSHSKLLKHWNELDNSVTECQNEARDNVRYMRSIQTFWEPLYRLTPPEIGENLPILLNAIRNVYQLSRFYNTSERVAGLLAKVANQIILNCQNYLTDGGRKSIWRQEREQILDKIYVSK
jgi:dynein heavy chain, axonemal